MDEKQLQLLWDLHAKNVGFQSFGEFKTLMNDGEARKVYFENANPDLGFANYQEFESTIGVKKKVSPLPSGVAGPEVEEVALAPSFEQSPQESTQPQTESILPEVNIQEPGAIEPIERSILSPDQKAVLDAIQIPGSPESKSPEQQNEEYRIAQSKKLTPENTYGQPEKFTEVVGKRIEQVAKERGQTPQQLIKDRKWYQADFLDPKYREEFKAVSYLEDTADRLKNALDQESDPEKQKQIIQQIYENSEKQGFKLDELRNKDEFKPFFKPEVIERAISDMGGSSDPQQTGLEKFNKYYNALHQEFLDLKENPIISGLQHQNTKEGGLGLIGQAGAALKLLGAEMLGNIPFIGGGTDGINRFYEIKGLLEKYAPIALLNRQPEYKDDTFLGSLGKSFTKGFSTVGKEFSTELGFAQKLDQDIKGLGLEKSLTDLKGLEKAAKLTDSKYEDYAMSDSNYWGSLLGVTSGLMGQMFVGIPAVGAGMRATKVGQTIIKLADKGADIRTLVKAKQFAENLAKSEKLGRVFSKATNWTLKHGSGAIKRGAEYGGTGILFPVQEDELHFIGGLFGYVGQESISALLPQAKRLTPILKKLFGQNGSERVVNILVNSGKAIGSGFGEVGEESMQEVASILREENVDFFDELDRRHGNLEDASKFLISTFVMGLGFGLASTLGKWGGKKFKDGLDDLKKSNPAEAAKVEKIANELSYDFEKALGGTIVDSFVERIKSGEKMTSPEDIQFYENNKEEIEEKLKTDEKPITPKQDERVTTEPVPPRTEQKDTGSQQEAIESAIQRGTEAGRNAEASPAETKRLQDKELEPLAKPLNELVDEETLNNPLPPGNEQKVFYNPETKTVTKVNTLSKHENWSDYQDRVDLQNELFPEEGYTLKGVTTEDGKLAAVVEQPYVKGTEVKEEDLVKDLAGMGFFAVPEGSNIFYNEELGVRLSDLHKGNVVKDESGDIRYIDPVIDRTNPFVDEQDKTAYSELKNRHAEQGTKEVDLEAPLEEQYRDVEVEITTTSGKKVKIKAGKAHKEMVVQSRRLKKLIDCLGKA